MAVRTVAVELVAKISGYTSGIGTAATATKALMGELDTLGQRSPGKFNDIAMAAGGAGMALMGMAAFAVKAAMEFDAQMSEVAAVANATAAQMDQLRQAALDAGKATQYSATEAAQAEAELAKAGMKVSDIVGGGLAGALSLAAAGQMDLADAATITATALNMFGLQSSAASHVADVFAAAANSTAADMHGLGMGLQQVGLVANQVGWSLEATTGVLGAFADRGLAGSDGATSLKTAIMALSAPTKAAHQVMQELGIKVYDSSGKFKDAAGIAGELQRSMGGLSQEQRQAALSTLFGSDAIRAANVLYGLGEQGVRQYVAGVYDQGAAARMAGEKTNNLAGDIERLKGSLETVAIQSGSGAAGGLRTLTKVADSLLGEFLALPGPIQSSVTIIAGLAGAGLLATSGILKARQSAMDLMSALRDAGPAGAKAAEGLGKLGGLAGKIGAVGVSVLLAYEGTKLFIDFLASKTAPVARDVDKMATSLAKWAESGQASGELAAAFGSNMQDLRKNLQALDVAAKELPRGLTNDGNALGQLGRGMAEAGDQAAGLNDKIEKAANQSAENFKALDQAMVKLVQGGNVSQAKLAFDELAARWTTAGLPLDRLNQLLPEYNRVSGQVAQANTGVAQGFASTEQQARTMTQSWQDAIDHGMKLLDLFNQLNGAATNSMQAQIRFEQALDGVSESFKNNKTVLDINTQAGQQNMQAILDATQAASKAAQAKYEETGSVQKASETYNDYIGRLRQAMLDAGVNKTKVDELIRTYGQMPPAVTTKVNAPGLDDANNKAIDLYRQLTRIDGTVSNAQIHVSLHQDDVREANRANRRWGGVTEYAASGLLRDASTYAAGSRPLYGFAEPSTGGEAFIPRLGDMSRSRAIAEHVVTDWLGGHVAWQPAQSSGTGAASALAVTHLTSITIPVTASVGANLVEAGRQIAEALRPYLANGGSLTTQLGR